MKKIINLRYPENLVIKSPRFGKKIKKILSQLNQDSLSAILSYLRLSEIVNFYESLRISSKLKELKRMINRYLVLTNRKFSIWEQKELLDLLISNSETKIKMMIKCEISDVISDAKHSKTERAICSPTISISDGNQTSLMSYYRQKISNDVERTHFNKQKIHMLNSSKNKRYSQSSILSRNQLQDEEDNMSQNCGEQQIIKMQRFLNQVLLAILEKNKKLGYIQGFNYIIKNMYLTGFKENQAFKYMQYFLECKDLNKLMQNNMNGLRELSYALKVYIFNYVPKIYQHFRECQVQPEIFSISWFVTLFSQDLSPEIVNKLWHIFILEGWKIFIQFAISILCMYQKNILEKKRDEIFSYLRTLLYVFNTSRKYEPQLEDNVWKLMSSIKVNDFMLKKLSENMDSLQNDAEIQIWRLKQSNRSELYSQNNINFYDNYSDHANMPSKFCCDHIQHPHTQSPHSHAHSSKIIKGFPFCFKVTKQ